VSAHAENGQAIVPQGRLAAVHFLAMVTFRGWNGTEERPGIACGHAAPPDPERWTSDTRAVTCEACRMHPHFARARAKR
jgi:hypothetical protein